MTRYRRGYEFERRVMKEYRKNGYYVMRSGGSKGVYDLICIKRGRVIGVQCKGVGGKVAERMIRDKEIMTVDKYIGGGNTDGKIIFLGDIGIEQVLVYKDGRRLRGINERGEEVKIG